MYKKALEIEEALGHKAGVAIAYGNLGLVYRMRGELDQAEDMYKKSLEINETLGRKEGMAIAYGNLGNVYGTRGEWDQAKDMYKKALLLFQDIGATSQVEQVRNHLNALHESDQR
jgi:tetratricopeptide (TPR) repeat protein